MEGSQQQPTGQEQEEEEKAQSEWGTVSFPENTSYFPHLSILQSSIGTIPAVNQSSSAMHEGGEKTEPL
jgi:hypothetical protein